MSQVLSTSQPLQTSTFLKAHTHLSSDKSRWRTINGHCVSSSPEESSPAAISWPAIGTAKFVLPLLVWRGPELWHHWVRWSASSMLLLRRTWMASHIQRKWGWILTDKEVLAAEENSILVDLRVKQFVQYREGLWSGMLMVRMVVWDVIWNWYYLNSTHVRRTGTLQTWKFRISSQNSHRIGTWIIRPCRL